jgi:cell division transport system permease protein
VLGGGIAIVVFALAGFAGGLGRGTAGGDQLASLFGSFDLGLVGYVVILGQIGLMALVTALTSRYTVNKTLATVE